MVVKTILLKASANLSNLRVFSYGLASGSIFWVLHVKLNYLCVCCEIILLNRVVLKLFCWTVLLFCELLCRAMNISCCLYFIVVWPVRFRCVTFLFFVLFFFSPIHKREFVFQCFRCCFVSLAKLWGIYQAYRNLLVLVCLLHPPCLFVLLFWCIMSINDKVCSFG